jgi:cyclophilin family peptidyl-prolyl cis-trans isomerase
MIRAFVCIVALFSAVPAWAEKRVALVIGNSAYQNVTPLDNPRNDARLIAATLAGLGFTLVGGGAQLDLDKARLETAIQDFGRILPGSEVAMFYYAGHGVQLRGSNYLVPVGANPTREADVDFQMIDVASVLRQMEGSAKLNLVVLDACRNNPFGSRGLRSSLGGLAQIQAPEGTLISYATQPGSVAFDGAGGNSPYSKALAETIKKPGLGIFDAFNQVGLSVKKATGGSQQPWVSSSPIDGNFYFSGAPGNAATATPPALAPDPCAAAQAHWSSVETIGTVAAYQDHLRLFAKCPFAGLAKVRIEEKTKVAVISPPPPAAVPRFVPAGVEPANVIVIDTTKGRIIIKLRADLAPHHAERIRQLAREGFYDNVPFHRVMDGFMAQTGDGQNFNGTGGSRYPNLKAEFSSTPYRRGIVGMARRGDSVDTANSQFFFMFSDAPSLNGLYTVIGEVVSGMDVVDKLKKAPPGSRGGEVTDPDKMVKVQVASDIK